MKILSDWENSLISISEFAGKRSFLIDHSLDNLHHKGFNLQFQAKTQQIHEEYLLYDETGVIGSIGGTLGLFIGFSFRSIIINFFERIRNVIINDARS